jgi:hypothetical protein
MPLKNAPVIISITSMAMSINRFLSVAIYPPEQQ